MSLERIREGPALPLLALWTVGHSNRSLAEFLELLRTSAIELVADVRRHPVSRRHPHFSKERLETALRTAEIGYAHLVDLGGHREERPGSPNLGLPSGPFRGYADHMATPAFERALERLLELARTRRTAVMCAEGRWQDCHRRLLSDRLVADGTRVLHLAPGTAPGVHELHDSAHLVDSRLVYARAAERGLFEEQDGGT